MQILAEEGPDLVKSLLIDKYGVQFDHNRRDPEEELSLAREGGHSVPRIVHAVDATGKAIEVALMQRLKATANVQLLTGFTAIDLLTPSHHSLNRLAVYDRQSCVGAYLLNQADGKVIRVLAKHTILATGGLGQIFLHNTNPIGARGDGIAMAYRAGARTINMEFVQFHPTTFYHPQAPRMLISEAVRGDGARLVHANGEPFMQNYDAQWKDLAPRDVVSRSIYHEMLERDVPNVYLDLRSYISETRIREHFPNIYQNCLQLWRGHHQRFSAGRAGRALFVRRHLGGRVGREHDRAVVRDRRGGLHRLARRESIGEHVAAGRAWCGAIAWLITSCVTHHGSPCPRCDGDSRVAGDEHGHARSGADLAGHERDQAHDVELCGPGAHDAPLAARAARTAPVGNRDREFLSGHSA